MSQISEMDLNQQPTPASIFDSAKPLTTLPPDALLSVLCRVPASDHDALWKTCKIVRQSLDSNAYAGERAATGWAEVTARLVPGQEMYDRNHPEADDDDDDESFDSLENYVELGTSFHDYDMIDIEIDVNIDGALAGRVALLYVPRPRRGDAFHDATDEHSRELQEVGCTLCDRAGRPRVRSIREADADGSARSGGFLYVLKVRIPQAYRPGDETGVVARAVRAALTVPELSGVWTLAAAISDGNVYMSDEDTRKRELWREQEPEERKRLDDRWKSCASLDARTFLQVGCKQIPEVVGAEKNSPPWLFALPRFFLDPIISHEDAMAITLHQPPDLPPDPTGVNEELLNVVKKASGSRKEPMYSIALLDFKAKDLRESMIAEEEKERSIIEQYQEMETMVASQQSVPWDGRVLRQIDSLRSTVAALRRRFDTSTFEERYAAKENAMNQERARNRETIRRLDDQMKAEVTSLVNERGASIQKSFVLHCSARFLVTEYIDFLLEFLPAHKRVAVINDVDTTGSTPLHCTLIGTPELSNADLYYRAVTHLLGLRASKDIVDPSGRTPLGQYLLVKTSTDDFARTFNLDGMAGQGWDRIHQRMERELRPIGGETNADKDARGDQNIDESDDDDEDFDDMEDGEAADELPEEEEDLMDE